MGDAATAGPASVERRIKIPTAAAAIAAITIGSTLYLGDALDVPEPVSNVLFVVTMCSMLAIPVAFLVAVIRRYLSRSALTQVLISLGSSPTTGQITAALREGLRDPGLRILYWSQDERSYLDEAGQPVADPRGSRRPAGRRDQLVHCETARRSMVADAALDHDPDLIEAAVVAARFSMDNALLLETCRRGSLTCKRPAPVSSRPPRWSAAGSSSDLHDGIQGRLDALGPRLGAVKATTTDQRAAAYIADIRDALAQVLTDLRTLAAGIRPDVLNLGLQGRRHRASARPISSVTIDLPDRHLFPIRSSTRHSSRSPRPSPTSQTRPGPFGARPGPAARRRAHRQRHRRRHRRREAGPAAPGWSASPTGSWPSTATFRSSARRGTGHK